MSKIDLVRAEMMKALKNRDAARKETLSLLLSALKAKSIDKRAELTEEEENAVIQKEIKQAQETMDFAPADRTDIIEECKQRIAVLSEFAPKMLSEDEIKAILDKTLQDLGIQEPKASDKGRIMKALMPAVKGKADGALVSKLVDALFK